ncbi:MAG: hypothetical protein KY443_00570, partial [Actinobacteria bacterium]|nr:hypothetical protein [Actinomycetota bacterium]
MHGFLAAAAAFAAVSVVALVAGRRLSSLPGTVGVVVVAGAAVAGAFLPGAATGIDWFDAVLRMAAAAVVTAVGSRAPVVLLAIAGVPLTAAAGAGPGAWLAGGATGVAVAMVAGDADAWALRAVVAAGLAVAAFDLERPAGATAVVAFSVLAVVVVVGLARLPRRERRWAWAGSAVVVLVVVVATAGGVLAALAARDDVEAGVDAARLGLIAARRGDTAVAADALDRAGASFADGRRRMEAWWSRPAAVVPVVAQHRRALSTLTETGA